MPVCCSMTAWACLAERGGCSVKYSSKESWWSARALGGWCQQQRRWAVQAAWAVIVEVALHGAPRDTGVGGDAVLGQTVAGQPEDFHLVLDAGVGVVLAVVGDGPQVFFGEQERRHGECSRGGSHAWSTP